MKTREGIQVQGGSTEASADGTTHTTSDAEKVAFKDWINSQLKTDPDCKPYLMLTMDNMFENLKDGIILWWIVYPALKLMSVFNKKRTWLFS